MATQRLTRRLFLRVLVAASVGGVLAGCGATPTPTAVPTATKPPAQPTAAPVAPTVTQPPAAPTAAPAQPTVAPTATKPPAPPTATTPPAPKVKRGGQVIEASTIAYSSWDVHTVTASGQAAHDLMFETLLYDTLVDPQKVTWELRPGLAEKWEQPDLTTIVFYLRKGVKFHDGSDWNADVAKWNVDRMRTDAKSIARTSLASIDTVDAVDASTLRIKLKTPSASMVRNIAGGTQKGMISKAQFEKLGAEGFALNPAGTGPMKLKSFKQDDRAVLEPFKDYWQNGVDGKPLPYIDEYVSRYIPDTTTTLVELQAGGVHAFKDPPPKDIVTLKANPNLALDEAAWVGTYFFTLGFKMTEKPFDNVKVRQAILCSIDREGMNKAAGFGVAKAQYYAYWGPGQLGYDETIPNNALDLDKAKRLLTEAGYPNGIEFTLKSISREPDNTCAQFQQQVWAKVGIKVTLQPQERLVWLDDMAADRFQVAIWRGGSVYDPDVLRPNITCGGAQNYSKFCDKELDALMDEGGRTLDEQKRQQIYRKVLNLLQEQAYVGVGINTPTTLARAKKLQGVVWRRSWPGYHYCWVDA